MIPVHVSALLDSAWMLNQELHCYTHADTITGLLTEQTKALRECRALIAQDQRTAVLRAAPRPAAKRATTVEWIGVEERLPDEALTVLIACTDGEVDAAFLMRGKWLWLTNHDVTSTVMAWCDMPEGPQTAAAMESLPQESAT